MLRIACLAREDHGLSIWGVSAASCRGLAWRGIRGEARMRRAKRFRAAHQVGTGTGVTMVQEISKTNNPPKNIRALTAPDQRPSPKQLGRASCTGDIKLGNKNVRGKR